MLYYYTARDVSGRFIRGSLGAVDYAEAAAALRMRAIFVTSLEQAGTARGVIVSVLQLHGAALKELAAFFRALATLVGAAVSLRRSLELCAEECGNPRLREALFALHSDVEAGHSLSDAMARHPREFSRLLISAVRAGELGGALDEVLARIATMLERDRAMRRSIQAALAYPGVVAAAAVGIVVFLLASVVPMFRGLYGQLHVPLPPITALFFEIGVLLRSAQAWGIAVPLIGATVYAAARSAKTPGGAAFFEMLRLKTPVVGVLTRKAVMERFARMLSMLLKAGVGLALALEVIEDVVGGPRYRTSLRSLRQALSAGSSIAAPLAESGLYENLFIQLIRIGEETGTLDSMLLRLADHYQADVETALAALAASIEPIMILFLGTIVGTIVAAVFIPLYTLIGSIK